MAVKLKSNLTNNDWNFDNNYWSLCDDNYRYWNLITDEEIYDLLPKKIKNFMLYVNCRLIYDFCIDTVGYFIKGNPIYKNSTKDLKMLLDKLLNFIIKNPTYEYVDELYNDTLTNKEIRLFIKYLYYVWKNDFILWLSI